MDKKPAYTVTLIKIKEAQLDFFIEVMKLVHVYLDENYPNAKAYMRNSQDGCYELYADIYEDETK